MKYLDIVIGILLLCIIQFSWISEGFAGITLDISSELDKLFEHRDNKPHLRKAKFRVAVFSYEDPAHTGLGDDLAAIVGHEILMNSQISSLGVLTFKKGLSTQEGSGPSYFDKVDILMKNEGVSVAVWGRVLPFGDKILIDTFLQLSEEMVKDRFHWDLKLPSAMGSGLLVAYLRPDRIRLQHLEIDRNAAENIKSGARIISTLRKAPNQRSSEIVKIPKMKTYAILERKSISSTAWVRVKIASGAQGWLPSNGYLDSDCIALAEASNFCSYLLRFAANMDSPTPSFEHLHSDAYAIYDQISILERYIPKDPLDTLRESNMRWWDSPEPRGINDLTKRFDRYHAYGSVFENMVAMIKISEAIRTQLRFILFSQFATKLNCEEAPESRKSLLFGIDQRECFRIYALLEDHPILAIKYIHYISKGNNDHIYINEYFKLLNNIRSIETYINEIALDKNFIFEIANNLAKSSLNDPTNTDILKNLAVLYQYTGDMDRKKLAEHLAEMYNKK